jgi:uncharacterized protein YjbI with pentapeptide repeats
MANEDHVALVKEGWSEWNPWRRANSDITLDLREADLRGADLSGSNLSEADLHMADLSEANLRSANLCRANLHGADLTRTNLHRADLGEADLSEANLSEADFQEANLRKANLSGANLTRAKLIVVNLSEADFHGAGLARVVLLSTDLSGGVNLSQADLYKANISGDLRKANLSEAILDWTDLHGVDLRGADLRGASLSKSRFADCDLSTAKGLETVTHLGPSTIGIDTLFQSKGTIPEVFLRGAGVPEDFIIQIPSLIAGIQPIQFHSCFISYSHQDEQFSRQLHSRMRDQNLRVWFAPEDMKGGRKLHEEIFSAIQIHDKLLLVLSERSMKSEWVMSEIRRARKVEREESRRKLFPIRLVDFEAIQRWECFDADSGKDLAIELREYYIPDFSNWKDHDAFEAEFSKLLRDLRATEA